MITRSKLVEQLRESQIRSQHKCAPLTVFSPKPHLITWADVIVAMLWALLFSLLLLSSYVTFYFRHFWISFGIVCAVVFLPIHLSVSRRTYSKKKERRLPLSM